MIDVEEMLGLPEYACFSVERNQLKKAITSLLSNNKRTAYSSKDIYLALRDINIDTDRRFSQSNVSKALQILLRIDPHFRKRGIWYWLDQDGNHKQFRFKEEQP